MTDYRCGVLPEGAAYRCDAEADIEAPYPYEAIEKYGQALPPGRYQAIVTDGRRIFVYRIAVEPVPEPAMQVTVLP